MSKESNRSNKINCINKLAIGYCCLLTHCKCYETKTDNNQIFDNSLSGILARDIFSESDSEEENGVGHYRLGKE